MTGGRELVATGILLFILPILALVGCDEDAALPGPGERCAPTLQSACAPELACVDGLCRPRAPDPTPEKPGPGPIATFDIVGPEGGETDAAGDTADTSETDAGPVVERVTLTTWDPETPAETRLALGIGQAAAVEVFVPIASHPEQLLVVAFRPDAPACGLFRPLIWLPQQPTSPPEGPTDVVGFGVIPDVIGVARPIATAVGSPAFAALPLPDTGDAPLIRAPHRVGVRYEGPCTADAVAPYIQLDASGDTVDTWVWSDAWIPGADLGLPGRWAFALQLRVD